MTHTETPPRDTDGVSEIELLDDEQVAAYLTRIGISSRPSLGIDALRELQYAHLCSVPFENLSIHLGEPILLELPSLFEKIVKRRRGGFCYELNGAFASLLRTLGFDVHVVAAAVNLPDGPTSPLEHLALLVDDHLVDVGFGHNSAYPLRLNTVQDQRDPVGVFRVTPAGREIDVALDGTPQYRIDTKPRRLTDFVPTCWYQQTHPASKFRAGPTCSLLTPSGRVTLSDHQLIVTQDGERAETALRSDSDVLDAYREHFGILLERAPARRGELRR